MVHYYLLWYFPTYIRPPCTFSSTGDIKPFHEALLPNGIMSINEFESSFSTRLYDIFEECAQLISKDVYTQAERKYRILGKESIDSIRVIDNIVNQINRSSMTMSYLELIMQTLDVSHNQQFSGKNSRSKCEEKRWNELFFQIKSFKPYKGQCLEVSDRVFHIHSLKMLIHQKYKLNMPWHTIVVKMISQVTNIA